MDSSRNSDSRYLTFALPEVHSSLKNETDLHFWRTCVGVKGYIMQHTWQARALVGGNNVSQCVNASSRDEKLGMCTSKEQLIHFHICRRN